MSFIEIADVDLIYGSALAADDRGDTLALSNANLTVGRNEFIALVGPRPLVTIEDGARAERTRLPSRVVRLLPPRGGGS